MKTILLLTLSWYFFQTEVAQSRPLSNVHSFTNVYLNTGIFHDYKVDEDGKIKLAKQTKDSFDRLIFIAERNGKVHYHSKLGQPLAPHILIPKGILDQKIPLKARARKTLMKGLKINFKEEFLVAKQVFEFLADHTQVEWSLLSFSIGQKSRTYIYTSFRKDIEYFGSLKVHHLTNCPLDINRLTHYHNHPRSPLENFGEHAFPSNSDLDFRDNLLKKGIPNLEFKIRTDGMYIDYGNPNEWNKRNGEDWM